MAEQDHEPFDEKAAVGDLVSFGLQPTSMVLTTDGTMVEAGRGFAPNMTNGTSEEDPAETT